MAVGPETQRALDALNTATTNLATRIQQIIDAENDLSPEGVAAFKVVTDNLNAMATNPNAPVPPLPPLET